MNEITRTESLLAVLDGYSDAGLPPETWNDEEAWAVALLAVFAADEIKTLIEIAKRV